jgi:hypothetical protein
MRRTIASLLIGLCASTAQAQKDTTYAERLAQEWRDIDSVVTRLLRTQRNGSRQAAAVELEARIRRANAYVDSLMIAIPVREHRHAVEALRLQALSLDRARNLQHRPCPTVDATSADSLSVSELVRKVSAEQCTLEDLASRMLERRALLAFVLESARQADDASRQTDSLMMLSRRVVEIDSILRDAVDVTARDRFVGRVQLVEAELRKLAAGVSELREEMRVLRSEMTRDHRSVSCSCECTGRCHNDRVGEPIPGGSSVVTKPHTGTPSTRGRILYGTLGALIGALVGSVVAR